MGIRLGIAFQCQKVVYPKHEEEEPPLLYIKQPNPGTSTIKPLPRTTNSRRPQMEGTYKQHLLESQFHTSILQEKSTTLS